VTRKISFAFFALLFAPSLVLAQLPAALLSVHGPFEPGAYKPLNGHERWQRWVSEDGRSPAIHIESVATATYLQLIPDPAAWNRSAGGYVRRLGSSYGSNLVQNSVHESLASD
jgi:hypothetical protein